jgi:hypothetical protein
MNCGCSTTTTEHEYTCDLRQCLSKSQAIDFLFDVFDGTDECVKENLDKETLEFLYEIAESEYNNPDLVFLSTYKSACYSLMSCYSGQFDITERLGENHSVSEGRAKTQGFGQKQAVGSNYQNEVRGMTARYSDYSRAAMDASASRNGCSRSESYGNVVMDDTGAGSERSRTRKRSILKARQEAEKHSEAESTTTDRGKSEGCDFSHTYSGVASKQKYVAIVAETEIAKAGHSTRSMNSRNISEGSTDGSRLEWMVAKTKKISVDGLRKDSCAQFKANVVNASKDSAESSSSNIYAAQREQKQRAEGDGFQRESQTITGSNLSEATSLQKRDTDSLKTNRSWRFSTIRSYKCSQKYYAMKMLYETIEAQIQEAMEQLGMDCGPQAIDAEMLPFIENANCGNSDWTIAKALYKFPFLYCYGNIL